MKNSTRIALLSASTVFIILVAFLNFVAPKLEMVSYVASTNNNPTEKMSQLAEAGAPLSASSTTVTHLPTPMPLKAVYMTSWVAGTPSLRNKVLKLMDATEINAVVIDIKDYTGKISFKVNDPELKAYGADENRISDIDSFIATLHAHGIYVIGRIASFQDPYMTTHSPQLAVKRASDGGVWQDRKGITWVDAGAEQDWSYLALIAKEAYSRGFDEVNYDYIRFPTDGNMEDISYPFSSSMPKHVVINNFFHYLHDNLAASSTIGQAKIPFSVDIFGLTTVATGDMGIGQEIGDALQYADYVSPMVYPSHFGTGTDGFSNPADHPYDIIKYSMGSAVTRAKAMDATSTASSTLTRFENKLRPWLQDFNLGATYTPDMVRAQIQATNDVGISSWMLWNASNVYTQSALLPKIQ